MKLPTLFLPLALLALHQAAAAATITLDANGRLTGAQGVLVNGGSYDVEFRDGTCAALFDGCDSSADFVFAGQALGYAAALALNSQVFNAFAAIDLDPTLTRGCENAGYAYLGQRYATCWVLTPLGLPQPGQVATYLVANDIRDGSDAVPVNSNYVLAPVTSTGGTDSSSHYTTWAVWRTAGAGTPQTVPEPSSLLLAGAGLLAAAAGARRRR